MILLAQLPELVVHFLHLLACLFKQLHRFGIGLPLHFNAVVVELGELGAQRLLFFVDLTTLVGKRGLLFVKTALQRFEVLDLVDELVLVRFLDLTGTLDDRVRQTDALGNGEGVRFTGDADH